MRLPLALILLSCVIGLAATRVQSPKGAEVFPDKALTITLHHGATPPTNLPFALPFKFPANAAQYHWWTLKGSTNRPVITNESAWFTIMSNMPWGGSLGVAATNGTASFGVSISNLVLLTLTNPYLSFRMEGQTNIPQVWR